MQCDEKRAKNEEESIEIAPVEAQTESCSSSCSNENENKELEELENEADKTIHEIEDEPIDSANEIQENILLKEEPLDLLKVEAEENKQNEEVFDAPFYELNFADQPKAKFLNPIDLTLSVNAQIDPSRQDCIRILCMRPMPNTNAEYMLEKEKWLADVKSYIGEHFR